MGVQSMFLCAILGCLVSLLIIPLILLPGLIRSMAARRSGTEVVLLDPPSTLAEKLGGVALVSAFLAVVIVIQLLYPTVLAGRAHTVLAVVVAALGMYVTGLWNDVQPFQPLGATRKLLIQILLATLACSQGLLIETFENPMAGAICPLGVWSGMVTVSWLVGLTNLIGLTNRINGLAGGIGLAFLALVAYVGFGNAAAFATLCALGMVGALVGFLIYNFPLARISMGTGGACFLGFLIGSLTILSPGNQTVVAAASLLPILAMALLMAGLGRAFARRVINGLPFLPPAREQLSDRRAERPVSSTPNRY